MRVVYVDNNATTKVADEVLEAMLPYLKEYYGNPSSAHVFGGQVAKQVDRARGQIAALLGADPLEIIITSCGTESDNAAIMSALQTNPEKRHIVTTRVEHPAVLNLCTRLSKRGYEVTEIPVDGEGMLDLEEVQEAIREDTAVVSVMYANNETGVIFPVEEIGEIVKERGALFHVDAVQVAGKIPLNMASSTIDMLSISGHKLHAPKGIGVLYVRRRTRFRPLIVGGHQERGRRGGTENVPYIIGLGAACELASRHLDEERVELIRLRTKLESELLKRIPGSRLNGHPTERLPNTANLSFESVEGEAILLMLDRLGICASSGSACTSGSLEPSHVLRAMGVPFTFAHGSVRLSLSRYNTEEEIDYIVEHLSPIIERLREISPYWKTQRAAG